MRDGPVELREFFLVGEHLLGSRSVLHLTGSRVVVAEVAVVEVVVIVVVEVVAGMG